MNYKFFDKLIDSFGLKILERLKFYEEYMHDFKYLKYIRK